MSETTRLPLCGKISSSLILAAIVALGTALPAQAADAGHGAKVFRIRCAECHSTKAGKNKIGPSLFGVVGRPAASLARYRYSAAMKKSGLTWTAEELDSYLTAPRKVVPHCKMRIKGLTDTNERADLIAYLSTLH